MDLQFPFNLRNLSLENLVQVVGPLPQITVNEGHAGVLFLPLARSNPNWIWDFLGYLRLLDTCISDLLKNTPVNNLPLYLGEKYVTKDRREAFFAEDKNRAIKFDFSDPLCILFTILSKEELFYNTYVAENDSVRSTWSSADKLVSACRQLLRTRQAFSDAINTEPLPGNARPSEYLQESTTVRSTMDACRLLLLCIPPSHRNPSVASALAEFENYEHYQTQCSWRATMVINNVIPVVFPFSYDDGTSGVYDPGSVVLFEHLSDNLQKAVHSSAQQLSTFNSGIGLDDTGLYVGDGRATSVHDDIGGWRGSTKSSKKKKAKGSSSSSTTSSDHRNTAPSSSTAKKGNSPNDTKQNKTKGSHMGKRSVAESRFTGKGLGNVLSATSTKKGGEFSQRGGDSGRGGAAAANKSESESHNWKKINAGDAKQTGNVANTRDESTAWTGRGNKKQQKG